jgi:hypothetical protein
LNKLYVWFETQAIPGGTAEQLFFEIKLWEEGHASNWDFTKPKLPQWCTKLQSLNFGVWAKLRGK